MVRKKSILWGIIILIIVSSCTKNNKRKGTKVKYYSDFRKTLKLHGTNVGPKDYFLEPRKMVLLDSLIVITDFKTSKMFHVVSRSNYNVIKSFGNKGEGPGEFQSPDLSKRPYKGELVITDRYITKIYDPDSMINFIYYEPYIKVVYPVELIIPYNLFYLSRFAVIGSTTNGKYRAFNYNPQTGEIKFTVDDIFFRIRNEKQKHLGQIFYSVNDYNYAKKKFISALRFFQRIDIYDNNLSLVVSIRSEKDAEPVFSEGAHRFISDKTVFHYVDVYTTSNYIYAIYCGKDFETATAGIGNELHVFSWSGEPICEVELDVGLSSLTVTDDEKTLIGLSWFGAQPIVVYDLEGIY